MMKNRESDRQVSAELERLLGAEALARLNEPLETAASLPNAAYRDPAFLDLEHRRLFARTWMLAGFGHQIPSTGDLHPTSVAGQPVLLARDREGAVRAYHNVCRHRGTRLVQEPCSQRRTIVCPYHAWTYDLDGRLLARPYFDGSAKHDRGQGGDAGPGLLPVRVAQWHDLIFVNLSGDAPPLDQHLEPLTARVEGYDLTTVRHAGTLTYEIEANWKFVHENFIETYHVFAVHPKLTAFAPLETRKPTAHEGLCFWSDYQFPEPEDGRGVGLPYYPGIPDDWKRRGMWLHFFPTVGIEVWPDQFTVFQVTPLGPERTREEIHVYLIGDAADGERYGAARQGVLDMWRELNDEDVAVLEQLQRGRQAQAFDGGCFSPHWEAANHHFCRLVVEGIK